MENVKYTVSRDNIYIGEVVKTEGLQRDYNVDFERPIKLDMGMYISYRSILFVPTKQKLANDLLFNSPKYPILNFTDEKYFVQGKGKIEADRFIIKNACNLGTLLEYYGYSKYLTFDDIIKLRKSFFTGRFAMDNCELFGYEETNANNFKFYRNGMEITDQKELRKLRKKFVAEHRSFIKNHEGVLSNDIWDILDKLGDRSLTDALMDHVKMNAFLPHKEEGPVKKLKRF